MYAIDINIYENREVKISEKQAGNTYENNETLLSFTIPECYSGYYKYLDIAMNDKKTQTVVSVDDESKFSYKLPIPLLESLTLYLQLVLKKDDKVFKSNVFNLTFNGSLCATQVLESEFKDSIEYLFEEKADKKDIDSLKNLLDLKIDKTTFYSYFDAQAKINGEKVDKIEGKELSSNDYTNEEKEKLSGLFNYNDEYILEKIEKLEKEKADKSDLIKSISATSDGNGNITIF